ncbi:Gfo/Idh/MocA family oxidoreductase [Halorarius litoreus]|uniref:Gfo/Idh/MocA family oxidoreductase n=1 Tax=Halorarius litoreus TaxID=2962676 RepID=UPI0020CB99D9|nr:Gfo/Idh/MocA family oxidoreductase [Halorarius litoreus]
MTRIGIVGLDTSHGEAFAEVLEGFQTATSQAPGPDDVEPSITAVWDSGTIRTDEYIEDFCTDVGAERFDDPGAMVDAVDAAFILAVDWNRHLELARPFLEAGLPTLIDKPIAGSLADVQRLKTVAATTPLFGGSAVPYHPEFLALPDTAERRSLTVAGYNDFFYYRSHTVDTAHRIVGAAWRRVTPRYDTEATIVDVGFEDGTAVTLRFDGTPDPGRFAALDVADQTRTVQVDAGEATHRQMYEQFLAHFFAVYTGSVQVPTEAVLDSASLLLGVEAALAERQTVTPESPILAEVERPSAEFVAEYEPYY